MPGLERAIEPRAEVREAEGGAPGGPARQMGAGGPEGARGAGGDAFAVTLPMQTEQGEQFAVIPTITPDGQPIPPEQAVEAVKQGQLEPIGLFPSMQEAEEAKAAFTQKMQGGGQGGGQPTVDKGLGAQAMGPPPDKQRAMRM